MVKWLLASLLVSLAASLATFPILAHHFHRASLIGVLANLPIVPLSGLLTALGLIYAGLSLLPLPGLHWLAQLLQLLIGLMAHLAHFFSSLPGASLALFSPSILMILFYYGFLLSAWQWRKAKWARISSLACLFLLASLIGAKLYHLQHRGELRVTFLDVGQGDCAVLELREGNFDLGQQVVKPYLLHRWVGRLDRAILSHPHPDHLRGLIAIVRDFPVEEAWEGKSPSGSPLHAEFLALLQQKGIPLRRWVAGERPGKIGPLNIEVLHPSVPHLVGSPRGGFSDENNNSLVLKIRYGGVTLLFTGDIGAEAETRILGRGQDVRCNALKIPHHGGRTSSTIPFIRAATPTYAIASAGAFNPFGHPSPETMKRYEEAGVKAFSTSYDGAIMLTTDGKGLRVWTAREERKGGRSFWLNWLGWD
jgi:competence protein ComEC